MENINIFYIFAMSKFYSTNMRTIKQNSIRSLIANFMNGRLFLHETPTSYNKENAMSILRKMLDDKPTFFLRYYVDEEYKLFIYEGVQDFYDFLQLFGDGLIIGFDRNGKLVDTEIFAPLSIIFDRTKVREYMKKLSDAESDNFVEGIDVLFHCLNEYVIVGEEYSKEIIL